MLFKKEDSSQALRVLTSYWQWQQLSFTLEYLWHNRSEITRRATRGYLTYHYTHRGLFSSCVASSGLLLALMGPARAYQGQKQNSSALTFLTWTKLEKFSNSLNTNKLSPNASSFTLLSQVFYCGSNFFLCNFPQEDLKALQPHQFSYSTPLWSKFYLTYLAQGHIEIVWQGQELHFSVSP